MCHMLYAGSILILHTKYESQGQQKYENQAKCIYFLNRISCTAYLQRNDMTAVKFLGAEASVNRVAICEFLFSMKPPHKK